MHGCPIWLVQKNGTMWARISKNIQKPPTNYSNGMWRCKNKTKSASSTRFSLIDIGALKKCWNEVWKFEDFDFVRHVRLKMGYILHIQVKIKGLRCSLLALIQMHSSTLPCKGATYSTNLFWDNAIIVPIAWEIRENL